jgi:hypothetical protein
MVLAFGSHGGQFGQLGLAYRIKDSYLIITCDGESRTELLPGAENPFVIVGHSLLALLAAALGGIAAPIIARRTVRPHAPNRRGA